MSSRLRRSGQRRAHFLHLGKTGGTAIKAALEPHVSEGAYQLELHGHVIRLKNIPRREPFFFAVRDPVDRYLSGFYSRQRQGAPRYHEPWSPPEKEAFERFDTANDLAEAIYAEDRDTRGAAQQAMTDIKHVRDSYWYWFGSERDVRRNSHRLLFVLFQDRLEQDFEMLVELLGLEGVNPELPTDATDAHRSPADIDRSLSDTGRSNLTRWYARDLEFFALCSALRAQREGGPSRAPIARLG